MQNLIADGYLRLEILQELGQPPSLWAPGETLFWDDPYISQQMLAAHLNPNIEPPAVARRPFRAASSGSLPHCRSRRGLRVTGMDYSRNSIAYARQ